MKTTTTVDMHVCSLTADLPGCVVLEMRGVVNVGVGVRRGVNGTCG